MQGSQSSGALSLSQRALAHSASGADGFHHTRPPIKYASRSRGLTQVYVRTQLGGQSLQNGDIAGSSAATRRLERTGTSPSSSSTSPSLSRAGSMTACGQRTRPTSLTPHLHHTPLPSLTHHTRS